MTATIWEEVKNKIKGELAENCFSMWINPITFMEKKQDTIVLGCPNKFSLNWVMENYFGIIEEKLHKTAEGDYKLSLKVMASEKKKPPPGIFSDSRQLTLPNVPRNNGNGRTWLRKEQVVLHSRGMGGQDLQLLLGDKTNIRS